MTPTPRGSPRTRGRLRILHLEDDASDAALIRETMDAGGLTTVVTCVQTRDRFVAGLEAADFDLILSDFSLPAFDGLAAMDLARSRRPEVPFILVSGVLGEEPAIDSLKRGATDYVLKGRLARLVPAVRRAMREVQLSAGRRRAESRRRDAVRRLRLLSRRLVGVQEAERRNIARELHDEIGQALTFLQLTLQAMLQAPGAIPPQGPINESLGVVGRLLEQVHSISLNLRPSILDDLGLEAALRGDVRRQAQLAGLDISLHADPMVRRLDPLIETECFRVAQEALTNVVRHAHATAVNVELRRQGARLHLRIRDDGVGFDPKRTGRWNPQPPRLGLVGMEERAALAGGHVVFSSMPGLGTEVHAWFPLKWSRAPAQGGPL